MIPDLTTNSVTHFHSPTTASHCQLIDLCVVVYGQNVPLGEADCLKLISSTALLGVGQVKEIFRKMLELAEGSNWKGGRLSLM